MIFDTRLISGRSQQEFSFGGEADSVYEYFLKEHILLGAAKEQYKNLYIQSVDAAEKYLFFRPLAEGDPDIRFSGKYITNYNDDGTASGGVLVGEMQHLVCYLPGNINCRLALWVECLRWGRRFSTGRMICCWRRRLRMAVWYNHFIECADHSGHIMPLIPA